MGDDFTEIYFICYYNSYITYYTILAVGSTIYSYAALYNCYYRTFFPPKETLNRYWIFKTFAELGIKFRASPILDKCSTTEPCASSNSVPQISHIPISPKLPAPWIYLPIYFLPEWICLVWTITTWWSQRICGPSCLASFSVCKIPLWVSMIHHFISLYYWLRFHTILLKY